MFCTSNSSNNRNSDIYFYGEDDEPRGNSKDTSSFTNHVSARRRDADDERFGSALVELQKKEGCGLGLVVSGGLDKDDRPCVSYLRPGGIAHRSDALEVGDYIVSVNGIRTSMLRHDEIVSLLKNAGESVLIEVEYQLPEPPQSTFSVLCKRVEIRLEKDGNSFGFTLRGGTHPDPARSRPLIVTQIRPGSSADREGTLKIGDRILAINNVNISQSTLTEAMTIIKHADREMRLLVEYDVSVMEAVQNASGPLLVEIDKTPGVSLGLTLEGAIYRGASAIVIEDIKPASIADRCGALHAGDEILSIDETSLEHMTVAEATQLLKCSSGQQIRIEILPVGHHTKTKAVIETMRKSTELLPSNGTSSPSAGRTNHPNYATVNCPTANGGRTANPNYATVNCQGANAGRSTHPNYVAMNCHDAFSLVTQMGSTGGAAMNYDNDHQGISRMSDGTTRLSDIGASLSSTSSGTPGPTYISNQQVCHTETTEVLLVSDHRGFGFLLQDSPFATEGLAEPPVIGIVEQRGVAERCGVLQEGDRILAINGHFLENRTLDEVNQLLIQAGSRVSLLVEFDVADSVVPSSGVFLVKLAKKGGGLGISIKEQKGRKPGDHMLISCVKKGSVAHRTGTIQAGDKLLAIDSLRMPQCTLEEAQEALDNAGDIVRLRIQREEQEEKIDGDTVSYTVELEKKGGPLGITISGTEEPFTPITISALSYNGLAERTGAIRVGDRILAINGNSLYGLPLSEALQLLQISGDSVTVKICRKVGDTGSTSDIAEKHKEGEEGDKSEGTPIPSVDSALESWDSTGIEGNMPHVPGKPPLPPKARCNNIGNNHRSNGTKLLDSLQLPNHVDVYSMNCDRLSNISTDESPNLTPSGSLDPDLWSQNVDNLDLLSQSDASHADSNSLSSFNQGERQTLSDGDEPNDAVPHDFEFGDEMPSGNFSTSTKIAAEMHLREVEEQMQNIFTPTAVELHRVVLFKVRDNDDFGFGLSDGVYEKGVYISAVRPGGPADRTGTLRAYDRILQINDVRIKDMDCGDVVPMIANAGRQLALVISRNPLAHLQHQKLLSQDPSDIWKPRPECKSCPKLVSKNV